MGVILKLLLESILNENFVKMDGNYSAHDVLNELKSRKSPTIMQMNIGGNSGSHMAGMNNAQAPVGGGAAGPVNQPGPGYAAVVNAGQGNGTDPTIGALGNTKAGHTHGLDTRMCVHNPAGTPIVYNQTPGATNQPLARNIADALENQRRLGVKSFSRFNTTEELHTYINEFVQHALPGK